MSLITIRENALLIRDPEGTPTYYHFKDGCTLKPVQKRFNVLFNSVPIDERPESQVWEISGRLTGEWENLNHLFPLLTGQLGASILGTGDVAWRLITASGRQWTFHRAGVTKRPGIMAKVGDTLLGDITITAVYSATQSATYAYLEEQTYPNVTANASNILTLAPGVNFGSGAFSELYPTDGVEIELPWELEPVIHNKQIIDYTLKSQSATAKLKPQNDATWAAWMTRAGLDLAMGASPPAFTLAVYYNGFYVELYNAVTKLETFQFKHDQNFIEGVTITALPRFSAGAPLALAYVSTSD